MVKNKDFYHRFVVPCGCSFDLTKCDPDYKDDLTNKKAAKHEIEYYAKRLRDLQYLLYAENKRSLLIVLQGLDASGKDGTIRHVLGYMNPQGCRVQAFKQPSSLEAAHDFLWRIHQAVPKKGEAVIFNRSHYEDVLVARVHNLVPKKVWKARYQQINAFESFLIENNTKILKFFLHISPDEQLRRFKKRLDDPNRWWKISESDYSERRYWNDYQQAYQDVVSKCSTEQAPWFVIPSNHKWFRNLAISRIVVEVLEKQQMTFPEPTVNLNEIRNKYHALLNNDGK